MATTYSDFTIRPQNFTCKPFPFVSFTLFCYFRIPFNHPTFQPREEKDDWNGDISLTPSFTVIYFSLVCNLLFIASDTTQLRLKKSNT